MRYLLAILTAFLIGVAPPVQADEARPWAPKETGITIKGYTIPDWDRSLIERSSLTPGMKAGLYFICDNPEAGVLMADEYKYDMDRGNAIAERYIRDGVCIVLPTKVTMELIRRLYMYVDIEDDLISLWEVDLVDSKDEKRFYALLVVESFIGDKT